MQYLLFNKFQYKLLNVNSKITVCVYFSRIILCHIFKHREFRKNINEIHKTLTLLDYIVNGLFLFLTVHIVHV